MTKKGTTYEPRVDIERIVSLTLEFTTYGSESQAVQTARTATKDMAVALSQTLSGRYGMHTFTFDKSGKEDIDNDFERSK